LHRFLFNQLPVDNDSFDGDIDELKVLFHKFNKIEIYKNEYISVLI